MKTKTKAAYTAGPVPKEAVEYFRSKGWKVGFDHRDVWREEHAYAFTVAKAMEIDVLESLRVAVDSAIADGTTFHTFQQQLQPKLEKLGWWGKKAMVDPKTGEKKLVQLGSARRLKVIYSQNIRSAQAAGQWERIERTKKSHPFLKYRLGPSENHRNLHVQWSGLILLADDPFWETHFPPNGWGCKCWVQQLRKATPSKSPKVKTKPWKNPRTGEIEKVPEGISPGFDFNPGKARVGEQLTRLKERLNTISPTVAEAVHRAWMQPAIFGRWRAKPQGNIPVAALDADTQALLGSDTRTVLLSDWSMEKQDGKHPLMKNGKPTLSDGHPLLSNEEYCMLPDMLTRGTLLRADDERLVYYHRKGHLYRAVVKATQDRKENYLVHFQDKIKERNYKAALKKYEVLRKEGD